MTIKEMREIIERQKKELFNTLNLEDRKKIWDIRREYLEALGYTAKYEGRLYLPKSARKEQVELYFTAQQIVYDIMINR